MSFRRCFAVRLLFGLLLGSALAAPADALEALRLEGDPGRFPLGAHLELLEDPSRELTLEQVASASFRPAGGEALSLGVTRSAHWFRFRLHNQSAEPRVLFLELDWAITDHADFFAPDSTDGLVVERSGDRLPFEARRIRHRNPVFRIDLPADRAETFYLRVEGSDSLLVPLRLWSREGFDRNRARENAAFGFYYGILFALILYNGLVFAALGGRTPLYFVFTLVCLGVWQLSIAGLGNQLLWPSHPWWGDHVLDFAGVLAAMSLLSFMRIFFETRVHAPRTDSWMKGVFIAFGVLLVLSVIDTRTYNLVVVPVACAGMVSVLVAGFSGLRRGFSPARDILVSALPLMAAVLVWGVAITYGAPGASVVNQHILDVGFVLTCVMLSLAVMRRLHLLGIEAARVQTLLQTSRRLSLYFPKKLAEQIVSSDEAVALESERRNLTIFFSDLTGFTALTDANPPERITSLLNEYLTEMMKVIDRHGGTLDKIMGDGIVGFFGAPDEMPVDEQARRAVSMAIEMQRCCKRLGEKWLREGLDHRVRMRIGIHQEYVTVGNFGSRELMSYTAIGGGVNLANRLEQSCTPGKVVVSYPVFAKTQELFSYGPLQERTFKGFARTHRVCELDPGEGPEPAPGKRTAWRRRPAAP